LKYLATNSSRNIPWKWASSQHVHGDTEQRCESPFICHKSPFVCDLNLHGEQLRAVLQSERLQEILKKVSDCDPRDTTART
jgi:hypothetical protein